MDALSNQDENETLPANLGPMRGAADGDGVVQDSDVLLDVGRETTGERTELEERRGARMRGWNVEEAGPGWPARTEASLFQEKKDSRNLKPTCPSLESPQIIKVQRKCRKPRLWDEDGETNVSF